VPATAARLWYVIDISNDPNLRGRMLRPLRVCKASRSDGSTGEFRCVPSGPTRQAWSSLRVGEAMRWKSNAHAGSDASVCECRRAFHCIEWQAKRRKAERGLNSLQFQPARLGYRQRRALPRNSSHVDTATGWQHRSRFRSIPVFTASAGRKCIVHKRRDKSGKLCRPGKNCGRGRRPIYVLFSRHAGNAPTFHEDGLGFHAQRLGAPARI